MRGPSLSWIGEFLALGDQATYRACVPLDIDMLAVGPATWFSELVSLRRRDSAGRRSALHDQMSFRTWSQAITITGDAKADTIAARVSKQFIELWWCMCLP